MALEQTNFKIPRWQKRKLKEIAEDEGLSLEGFLQNEQLRKMASTAITMTQTLEREPTDLELAEEMGREVEDIRKAKSYGMTVKSLDVPVANEFTGWKTGKVTEPTLAGLVADDSPLPDELCEANDVGDRVSKLMDDALDEREQAIIKMRFGIGGGEPMALKEIGETFNLTRERIRQIEAKALHKMRHPKRKALLEELVPQ